METNKLKNILENVSDKSNKDLFDAEEFLYEQHESLKSHIIELTHKLESLENLYNIINGEIQKRKSQ